MTRIALPGHDAVGLRAENPSPFTLSGTNSWIVGRNPCWLIDPGPQLTTHVDALEAEVRERGELAGIVLTHDHLDHSEAVPELRLRFSEARTFAARGEVDRLIVDGDAVGPLRVMATPGHAPDHLAFLLDDAVFSGDAVLGAGSVFIFPDPGALAGYLDALERLLELRAQVLAPGHGPLVLDVGERLREQRDHRLERERRLLIALDSGLRSVEELLDMVWSDAPPPLRPAATVTLAAHLDKLRDEGRLPDGVQRPGPFRF